MTVQKLARELRQRQYEYGKVDRKIIDALSNQSTIDSYVTCSCCGEKQVDDDLLSLAVQLAENVDDFFSWCDILASSPSSEGGDA